MHGIEKRFRKDAQGSISPLLNLIDSTGIRRPLCKVGSFCEHSPVVAMKFILHHQIKTVCKIPIEPLPPPPARPIAQSHMNETVDAIMHVHFIPENPTPLKMASSWIRMF